MSFSDKVVIVTGSSSGIGAATALLFSKEQANVVIVGRKEMKLKIVTAQCEEVGNKKPLVIKADITNEDEAASIIKQTIDKFGKLDILVNNAGIVRCGNIMNGKILQSYDEVIKTNLRAVINLTQLAISHLIKAKGNIINITSIGAMKPIQGNVLLGYGTSKAALHYFTQGAALELADHGVRVNLISPGPVLTNIFANNNVDINDSKNVKVKTMGNRISSPEEIGNLILYLASDKAVGVTGSNFVLDNGSLLLS